MNKNDQMHMHLLIEMWRLLSYSRYIIYHLRLFFSVILDEIKMYHFVL
jgi:hypothetical protein